MTPAIAEARLRQILESVKRQMAAVAWQVLRDPHDADDAIQDTLANIWARRRSVMTHPQPPALILRMCFQCAIDRLRVRERRCARAIPRNLPSGEPGPERALLEDETRGRVLREIAALPGQQAEAIYLRVIERMEYDQVAAALGCDESTARVHVRRAREKLREALADLIPNEVNHDTR